MEDFPRGGANALTPLEVRKIKETATQDVLFGKTTEQKKKAKTKKKSSTKESETSFKADTKLKSADPLSFKRLTEGMKILGCIREIQTTELVINLPNSLNGYVPITSIHDVMNDQLLKSMNDDKDGEDEETEGDKVSIDLNDIFHIGQFVPTIIKGLDSNKHGYKKIALSLDPKDLNAGVNGTHIFQDMLLWGYVSGVEDHGCIISFGIKGMTGFIPSKDQGNLKLGSIQWFVVKKTSERVITVSAEEEEIPKAKIDDANVVFNNLYPGALVNAVITQTFSEGLSVAFNGFEGIIDQMHLPDPGNKCKVKKKLQCRITYIKPTTKLIGLSATNGIISLQSNSKADDFIGAIEECTVLRADANSGLLVKLENERKGFVHISRISDKRVEKLGKKFKADTVHRCRIVGYNGLDGLFIVSLEKSVIEQPFLRYVDIKPGMPISGTIITLEDFGMIVKVSDHMKGLCPRLHLADINLKHPEKKLKDGKKVECRVLSVNPERKRLKLTHKKTLVESDLPIITSYNEVSRGMRLHGFIDSIREFGLIIRFYNFVKGLALKSRLGLQENEKIEDVFYLGQVVKCRVLYVNAEEKKLKLTLNVDADLERKSLQEDDQIAALKLFQSINAEILTVKNDGLDVRLSTGLKAFVKKEHLSDFKCNYSGFMFLYQAAKDHVKTLQDLMYLGEQRKRQIVSKKGLVKVAAKNNLLVSNFEEIKVGLTSIGIIHHIMPYGIFIELSNGVVGLAPNSNLADYFVSNPSSHFYVGQTVLAKVLEIDEERKRLLVTLKPSEVTSTCSDVLADKLKGTELLKSVIEERKEILDGLQHLPEGHIQKLPSLMGKCTHAKVISVKQEGIRLQTENGCNGFVPAKLRQGIDVETGDTVKCFVIDIDMEDWLFIGTLQPEILDFADSQRGKVKAGANVEVIIQHVTPDYMLASIPRRSIPVAYIVGREHLNDIRDVNKRFFVGQKLRATVSSITSSGPLLVCDDSFEGGKPKLGSIVTATVKAIKATQVNVSVQNTNLHGRIYISEVWDEIKEGQCPLDEYRNGESIRCKVIGFRDIKTNNFLPISHQGATKALAELSCRPSVLSDTSEILTGEPKSKSDFKKGETVPCFVKAVSENFMTVFVNQKVNGRISLLHSSTDRKVLKHFSSHFKHGAAYTATVLDTEKDRENLELSLIGDITSEVKKNGVVCGKITKVLPRTGLLVELPGHKCGLAHITQLHDEYKEDPLEEFKPKMFVKCCILSIKDDDQIDLSLRPSRTLHDEKDAIEVKDRAILSLDDIHENDIVRGYIKSCTACGVFVGLSQKIVGRVQIKNLSKYFVKNWQELFPVGKLVKAKVLSIDANTNNIELSLRGPDVKDVDPAPKPAKRKSTDKDEAKPKKKKKRNSERESEELFIQLRETESSDEDDVLGLHQHSGSDESDADEEETTVDQGKETEKQELPRLKLSGGFDWGTNTEEQAKKRQFESDSESEEETEKTGSVKKTKRQKRADKKAEEEYLYKTELALLDKDRGPESAEDFDRLLLGSPNNSMLWIQYMAFYLHSAEIDKARAIAERALKTISFREEQEKLNVWIASLNLECLYGSDETVQNIFNEAVRRNDPKKIYLKMAEIYAKNDKPEKVEKLYQTMTKRFNTSKKVWINFGFFLMKNGKTDAARKLLQRSFQSLPTRKHINTILKFALMEFRFGEAQKGVTMFESVLKNHPKRTDIWSVYIDMLIKEGDFDQVRNIFEKIITLNLSTKKMKFIFKRYLELEKKYGDDRLTEGVKSKAMEYVESKVAMT